MKLNTMSTTMTGRDYLVKNFRAKISCAKNGLYLKGQGPSMNGSLDWKSLFHYLVSQIPPVHVTFKFVCFASFIFRVVFLQLLMHSIKRK